MDSKECHIATEAGLLWSHQSLSLMEGKCMVVKGDQGGEEYKYKLQVSRQSKMTDIKEHRKTSVDAFFIKIGKSG